MHSPYLSIRTVSVAMILGEMENIFQKKGGQNQEWMFPVGRNSDFSEYASFIQENIIILGNASPGTDLHQCDNIPLTINETAKNRFMSILSRAIKAHEGVSRQERLFVHRFWSEIQRNNSLRP